MRLPQKQPLQLMQTTWAQEIEPVLSLAPNQGQLISNISLINGVTTINHKLGRTQLGWILADIDSSASIHRSAPLNNLTLTLTSTAACNISLWVF